MDELVGRGAPRFRERESGVAAVWRMLSGEWRMAMGGGCCVGAVVWEQVMLLVMVRWL